MITIAIDDRSDFALDSGGNLQLLSGAPAVAQDIGQSLRMVRGENQFNVSEGIDYFNIAFTANPDYDQLRSQLIAAAKSVPDVGEVTSLEIENSDGELTITMQTTSTSSTTTISAQG